MSGGKSTYILDKERQFRKKGGLRILVIKHAIATNPGFISTHWGGSIPATSMSDLLSINMDEWDIIFIDEAHWFSDIYEWVKSNMHRHHIRVFISGLIGDKRQYKFGNLADIMPLCSHVEWKSSICEVCGDDAPFSKCRIQSDDVDLPGGMDLYYTVCHWHLDL